VKAIAALERHLRVVRDDLVLMWTIEEQNVCENDPGAFLERAS
jgi:hypothetical protein